jgi:hypothetical protein
MANLGDFAIVGGKESGVLGQSASRYLPASGLIRWPAGAMDVTRLRRLPDVVVNRPSQA